MEQLHHPTIICCIMCERYVSVPRTSRIGAWTRESLSEAKGEHLAETLYSRQFRHGVKQAKWKERGRGGGAPWSFIRVSSVMKPEIVRICIHNEVGVKYHVVVYHPFSRLSE